MLSDYYQFLCLFFWLLLHGRNFMTNEKLGIRLSWQVAKIVWLE